jgi:NTP pyrophosphatase (non-canonical NTP hydrolase)
MSDLTLKELAEEYKAISKFFNDRWPLPDHQQRVFARTMKIMEEMGELSDELLTSMNLSRDSKIAKFSQENIEDEFADVLACVVALGLELDIDMEAVMRRKIKFTHERYEMDRK